MEGREGREGKEKKEGGRRGGGSEEERQRADEDNFLAEKPIQRNLLLHSCCKTCISLYTTPQIQFSKPHLIKKLYRAHYSGILLMRNWESEGNY